MGFWLHDETENDKKEMKSIILRLSQREKRAGATEEANFIIKCLEEAFEDPSELTQIAKKIIFVSR